ncbi:MAG: DUF2202 domain-containing protein [Epsilonproteobacteria bacterium]|nr:DUF2202 domain-containing protein [Campylobacterota bacterium]
MRNIIKGSFLAFSAILFFGCGSGGDTSSDSTLSGSFVDTEVDGLQYITTSGFNGVTANGGKFKYKRADRVEFRIGKLILGSSLPAADGLITPEFLADNNDTATLMLRLLQSLDIDDNTTDGITIPDSVVTALENLSNYVDIDTIDNDEELLDLSTELAEAADEDYDGVLDVDTDTAWQHYAQSLEQYRSGLTTSVYYDPSLVRASTFDLSAYPVSDSLSQDLKDALSHMGNEERLAHDLYINIYNYHVENSSLPIKQLYNIAERSEKTHVEIVQDLVRRYDLGVDDLTNIDPCIAEENNLTNEISFYDMPSGVYDIPAIQDLYNILYEKGINSQRDALEVGCMVEVTDINDLDNYITIAEDSNATDVIEAFKFLRDGSYSHYWAFDKGLKNIGISEGCCTLGTIDGVNYCHPEYPQD